MKITSTVSEFVIEWEQERLDSSPRSLAKLKSVLSGIKEIQSVRFSGLRKKQIIVVYRSPKGVVEFLRQVTKTLRTAQAQQVESSEKASEFERNPSSKPQPVTVVGTLIRWTYGGLAVGSFVMSWIGLVAPGIPTIPFVILTIYFAGKFSPRFRNRMMSTPVIGTMMRDWSEHRALRRSIRDGAFFFVIIMVLITMLFMPVDSIMFPFMVMFGVMSLYFVRLLPVYDPIESQQSPRLRIA